MKSIHSPLLGRPRPRKGGRSIALALLLTACSGSHDPHADEDHSGHDHAQTQESPAGETSQPVDLSALTGQSSAIQSAQPAPGSAPSHPSDPRWALLPRVFPNAGMQFQVRQITQAELEAAHAILGPSEARECALLVKACQNQFGIAGGGAQLAVLAVYEFADESKPDRFLELVLKGSLLKDEQTEQGGQVQISESVMGDVPHELGKGLDFQKIVQTPGGEVPVRSIYVAQRHWVVEVTLSNITLDDAKLHALLGSALATLR